MELSLLFLLGFLTYLVEAEITTALVPGSYETTTTFSSSVLLNNTEGSGYTGLKFPAMDRTRTKSGKLICRFRGPYKSMNRKHELECCRETVKYFRRVWFNGGYYLTTYFEKLKIWRCPQYEQECRNKTYAFNDFSRLVYAHNCNQSSLEQECASAVKSAIGKPSIVSWNDVINDINSSELSFEQLIKPCVQIALYQSKTGGDGHFHEVVDVFIPFCGISWCGYDSSTVYSRSISSWTCMSTTCRANIIISIVVCAFLATAIIFANVTVILVFSTSPKLRNSQAVYKISLAIADLLVGIIVIPTFISSLILLFKSRTTMGTVILNTEKNIAGMEPHYPGGYFKQRFTADYLNFVGFFTSLSLVVSIYTLMMASLDRFMAIYMPLRYGRHNAKRMAMWSSLALWITGLVFSILPFLVNTMKYGLIASILVSSSGPSALYIYGVAFVIPLLFVWVTTLATYLSTRHHAKRRQAISVRRTNSGKSGSMETRLARTLAAMVGVFTLCLLPTATVIICSMLLTNIYHTIPSKLDTFASSVMVSLEFTTILVLMTNSLWNCFIYNARSDDFKSVARSFYIRLLRALGVRRLWRRTRRFTSTMRSSTLSTSAGTFRSKHRKKMSLATLRTVSNNDVPNADGNGGTMHAVYLHPIRRPNNEETISSDTSKPVQFSSNCNNSVQTKCENETVTQPSEVVISEDKI